MFLKKLSFLMISLFFISSISAYDILNITDEQKDFMLEHYQAEGYFVDKDKCHPVGDCFFCPMEIGTWKEDRVMITCDFISDSEDGKYSMSDLIDKKVISIVNKLSRKQENSRVFESLDFKYSKSWYKHQYICVKTILDCKGGLSKPNLLGASTRCYKKGKKGWRNCWLGWTPYTKGLLKPA